MKNYLFIYLFIFLRTCFSTEVWCFVEKSTDHYKKKGFFCPITYFFLSYIAKQGTFKVISKYREFLEIISWRDDFVEFIIIIIIILILKRF